MRDLGPGRRIGRFVVERKLGQGGMGAVFLVADERGARLALKLIAGEDEDWTRRFEREARAALAIHHEHVARVLPLERHEGLLMLPMELLEGGTLKDVVKARGPLPWREAATLGAAIARGLAAIHAGGFVHRDLKPANVLLDGAGRPKITDFGLVKRASGVSVAPGVLTRTGEILGTFEYLAPELAEGSKVDARADLYSLGATLYELLSGAPPFAGTGYMLVARHLRDRPASLVPRGVPKDLDALVLRLLAKRPDDRPPTATAVAEELESLLGEKPPSRSARAPWIAIPILLGAALVAGVFFGTHREPTEAPRPPTVTPPPPPRVFKDRYHAALEGWNEGELETATGQADTAVTASAILSMALSGDGRVLLTAGEDATVKRWDPGKTTPASTRMNFQSPVVGIAFVDTQGPNPAVLSLERHHGLKLWRLTGDRVIGFLDPMSKDEGATGLVVGGKDRLAIASNGRDAPSFYCAIEPESPGVFQGWSWLRVRVPGSEWNTGPPVTSYDAAIAGVESFVVAGAVLEAHGLFVRGKPHPTDVDALEEETDPPVAVAFLDAAGDRVLAASEHGVVSLWDIGSKMRVWSYRGLASVTRVAALDEHRALVLSGTRVVVLDADAKDASRVRSSFDLGAADDRPTCVLVDGGARRLWLGTAKGALLRIHLR